MKPLAQKKTQDQKTKQPTSQASKAEKEIGGRKDGLDPTRYGDWEKNGRCIDF